MCQLNNNDTMLAFVLMREKDNKENKQKSIESSKYTEEKIKQGSSGGRATGRHSWGLDLEEAGRHL